MAASVHDERKGLGRGTKAEGYGVAAVALGEDRGGGTVGGCGLGVFEVVGSF